LLRKFNVGTAEVPRIQTRVYMDRHINPPAFMVPLQDVGRLAVVVQEVRVRSATERAVAEAARTLPERLDRLLRQPLIPIEMALAGAGLSGGQTMLRPPIERMRGQSYFDLEIHQSGDAVVRRFRVNAVGERKPETWIMTREQLSHLVDELT